MVKEVLMQSIKNVDAWTVLIALGFTLCWFFTLQFGFYTLTGKINFKELATISPFAMTYSMFARLFLPDSLYIVGFNLGVFLILKILTKERAIKVMLSTAVSFVTGALGFFFIGNPITLINDNTKAFFLTTTSGLFIGTLFECIGPAILVYVFKAKRIILYPKSLSLDNYSIAFSIVGLGLSFWLCYSLSTIWAGQNSPERLLNFSVAAVSFISFIVVVILNWRRKRLHREEQKKLEENHRKKVLELATTLTTACKHQIDYTLGSVSEHTVDTFRLCLLNLAETLHKTKSIDDVYDKIIDIASDDLDENPIFKQILMTKRMENMSTRLRFVVTGNHDLKDYNDADFWQLFSVFLNICSKSYTTLNYPINSGRPSDAIEKYYHINIITIAMDEHGDYVAVTIYTSNKIEHTFTSWERMRYHASESDQPYLDIIYKSVENNISDFTYGIVDGHIMSVSYTYKKKTVDEMVL